MSLLEIYIPTYRRPKELDRLLSSIPKHPKVTVTVADNAQLVEGLCAKHGVNYRPRFHNIGANANILSGTVDCEAPWLWTIGDDDWLLPGALDLVLAEIEKNEADRIICYTEAADSFIPDDARGTAFDDGELINLLRPAPSLLIATTLISSNVVRVNAMDVEEGLRRMDTHYGYSHAMIGASRWVILDKPAIGVGTEYAIMVHEQRARWQDYLNALCVEADVPPVPILDAARWNFCSVEAP